MGMTMTIIWLGVCLVLTIATLLLGKYSLKKRIDFFTVLIIANIWLLWPFTLPLIVYVTAKKGYPYSDEDDGVFPLDDEDDDPPAKKA